jgi:hypothetical protein
VPRSRRGTETAFSLPFRVQFEGRNLLAARRKIRLTTIGGIKGELGRVYRRADAGEMDWQAACCAARLLREIRMILETSDLEERVAQLEARLEAHPAKPNGSVMTHVPTYR